jgi:hypothetical protein
MVNLSPTAYKYRGTRRRIGGGKGKRKPRGEKFWRRREGQ